MKLRVYHSGKPEARHQLVEAIEETAFGIGSTAPCSQIPSLCVLPLLSPNFKTINNYRQIIGICLLIFGGFRQQTGKQKVLN
jgi:hypothetical protein